MENQTSAMVVREGFSSNESTALVETSSTAVAAQAKAKVEAHFIVAMKRPRDLMVVREQLLKACRRPRFAETARYTKPIGGSKVSGPSVRFAEEAIRALGNILPETSIIYDDAQKRIVRVTVTDLEANVPYSTDVIIEKTVERSSVRPGQRVISQRQNSGGKTTYTIEATEDDLLVKQAAIVSKALRTNALRLLPGDLLEEAMDEVQRTIREGVAIDPDAAKKRMADNFARIGISPAELKKYLGKDLSQATPDEMAELHAVGMAIGDKETTWVEALEAKRGSQKAETKGARNLREVVGRAAGVQLEAVEPPPSDDDIPPYEDAAIEPF